ncbi:MAG: TlpA family protein disulfide reductase [Verrucomicrobiales bacterium]|nr:TlpA family protein disulfide reductase [Verrucomicrobiales bacterium]
MKRGHWQVACLVGFLTVVAAGPSMTAFADDAATDTSAFRQAVDAVQKVAHNHPERSSEYYEALERGFRELQSRFAGEGEVYAELLYVADHMEGPRAIALLNEILAWPAPTAVKEKARGVISKKRGVGQPFDRTVTTVDGVHLRLGDLKGKVVLIDFWASWCPPCREKLPELKALYTSSRARGLEIVGISFDDDLATLRRFVANEGITWSQVADGKGWSGPRAAEYGITSLPTLWLIDRQGRLRNVDARETLESSVRRLLEEPGL